MSQTTAQGIAGGKPAQSKVGKLKVEECRNCTETGRCAFENNLPPEEIKCKDYVFNPAAEDEGDEGESPPGSGLQ